MPFSIICVRSSPARPTKGRPVRSSCSPGPSPTNRIVGVRIAVAEDDLLASLAESAAPAVAELEAHRVEGSRRVRSAGGSRRGPASCASGRRADGGSGPVSSSRGRRRRGATARRRVRSRRRLPRRARGRAPPPRRRARVLRLASRLRSSFAAMIELAGLRRWRSSGHVIPVRRHQRGRAAFAGRRRLDRAVALGVDPLLDLELEARDRWPGRGRCRRPSGSRTSRTCRRARGSSRPGAPTRRRDRRRDRGTTRSRRGRDRASSRASPPAGKPPGLP